LARFAYGLFVPAFRDAFGVGSTATGVVAAGGYGASAKPPSGTRSRQSQIGVANTPLLTYSSARMRTWTNVP